MNARKLLPLLASAALLVAALAWWLSGAPSVDATENPAPAPVTTTTAVTASTAPPRPPPAVPVAAVSDTAMAEPTTAPAPHAPAPTTVAATRSTEQQAAARPSSERSTATAPITEEPQVSKDDIRTAVREVLPGLRRCYAPVAERDASPHKVVVRFTLVGQGSSGFFKDADIVESTLNEPLFLSCFLQELSQARFRAPWGTGEVTITYPFTLAGAAGADGGQ
jgi:hypothetical protein